MASMLLGLSPGMSAASPNPPPCFPERVVMQAAWMHDDTGRIVGGIRSGQEVRILEEKSPDHPGLTLVETKGPVVLRGWLDMYQLRVFTRRELETVPVCRGQAAHPTDCPVQRDLGCAQNPR
jgi:hypothetical protein